ncbi:hypothetical protein BH18ACI4_BH18ACI4_19990 [soil metagenome]
MAAICITPVTQLLMTAANLSKRTLTKVQRKPNKKAQLGIRPNQGEHAP